MMKENLNSKIVLTLSLLALCFILLAASADCKEEKNVVQVTGIKGKVFHKKTATDKEELLTILSELKNNEIIQVGEKSQVKLVFFNDVHFETIKGPAQVKITKTSVQLIKGSKKAVKVTTAYKGLKVLRSIKVTSEKYAGVGAKPLNNKDYLFEPRGMISDAAPLFKWEEFKGAEQYRVILLNTERKQIFNITTSDNSLTFPVNINRLEPGKSYFWRLEAIREGRKFVMGEYDFKLLDESGINLTASLEKQIHLEMDKDPSKTTPLVILLTYYFDKGMVNKTKKICEKLLKIVPENKQLIHIKDMLMGF